MDKQEWTALAQALKGCINSRGDLYYAYDCQLQHLIEPCSPDNNLIHWRDYRCKGRDETTVAIDRWVANRQQEEEHITSTHAQLELGEFGEDATARVRPHLIKEKKLLVRGVVSLDDEGVVMGEKGPEDLFSAACRAVEIFQDTPTGLVLFPNIAIRYANVFGGFYGSPWSVFNDRTLALKFRNTNPHFKIRVCTVSEKPLNVGRFNEQNNRRMGVLFTHNRL